MSDNQPNLAKQIETLIYKYRFKYHELRASTSTSTQVGNNDAVRANLLGPIITDLEALLAPSPPKPLYLVPVATTLENDFDAGCWVAVEADDADEAEETAYNAEAEAVGSDKEGSGRVTTVGSAHLVPPEAEAFIRETFKV